MLDYARINYSHAVMGIKRNTRADLQKMDTSIVKIPYAIVLKQWDFISPSTAERMKPRLSNFGIG